MIKGHTVDDHEAAQVVLVRRVVSVPGHHVERREILHGMKTNKKSLARQRAQKALNRAFQGEKKRSNIKKTHLCNLTLPVKALLDIKREREKKKWL